MGAPVLAGLSIPTIVSLATAATGAGLQFAAAEQAQKRSNAAAEAELERQRGYHKQSTDIYSQSLEQSKLPAAQKSIAAGTQNLADVYKGIQATPISLPTSSTSAPVSSIVEDPQTRTFNKQSDVAASAFGGYAQFPIDQAIKNLRAAQQQGLIGSEAQMSQQVLPLELQHAVQSTEALRGIGGILGTVGGVAAPVFAAQTAGLQGATALGAALGGVSNLGSLTMPQQQQYAQMYNYYNNPAMAGWRRVYAPQTVPTGTSPYE